MHGSARSEPTSTVLSGLLPTVLPSAKLLCRYRRCSAKSSANTPSAGVQQSAQNRRNQRSRALVSAGFRLWEQEVPGGDSHRANDARCSV
jgi:hypothetical protein